MDEVVELLSGGIVAELLYLLVGDFAAPFDRGAQRGIIVLRGIVPGVTALVEDCGLFRLIGIPSLDDDARPHREKVLRFYSSTAYLGIGLLLSDASNTRSLSNC